ncbi:MAG: hypothetical protein NUV73_03430 [Candidatus Daviesbacteria bacterium]|nr:hypothetical protein [Candidatus Daviesbacteria bacterium]
MSNQAPSITDSTPLPPPCGDSEKADHYLAQLIDLMNEDKLIASHTDLAKFDPTSLQDHYRMDLKEYEVEVSHNKQANTGKDFYILLFNNLKSVNEKCTEKVILAYINIDEDQFAKFKIVADNQLERKRKEAEQKRFKAAMTPIDQALEQASSTPEPKEESVNGFNHTPPAFAEA